jgi:hypothetical protein
VTHEPTSALHGLIDHFVTVVENFQVAGHGQDYSQAPNYWIYGSCMSHGSCSNGTLGNLTGTPDLMLDENDVNPRAFPLVAYMAGAQAALYFSAMQQYSSHDVWSTQYDFGGNGDGQLLYPGISGTMGFTQDEPVMSIRTKAMRQGEYDIEYLNLAKQAGLSTNAATLIPNQFNWSRNNSDYEALRQFIGNTLGK